MKVLILHLSDIHFQMHGDLSRDNIKAIVNAISTTGNFSSVIVVVSGDITYSGMISQYNTAYIFFATLKNQIKKKFDVGQVEFCIVPGNHDVDHTVSELSRDDLNKIFLENRQDECIDAEKQKMKAFYNHANGLHCFSDKKSLVHIKEISIEGTRIRFNLINTGIYS